MNCSLDLFILYNSAFNKIRVNRDESKQKKWYVSKKGILSLNLFQKGNLDFDNNAKFIRQNVQIQRLILWFSMFLNFN